MAGLARVRAEGKKLGRPMVGSEVEDAIRGRLSAGDGMLKVSKVLGVGVSTVQRVKAEMPAAAGGDGDGLSPVLPSASHRSSTGLLRLAMSAGSAWTTSDDLNRRIRQRRRVGAAGVREGEVRRAAGSRSRVPLGKHAAEAGRRHRAQGSRTFACPARHAVPPDPPHGAQPLLKSRTVATEWC